MFFGFSSNLSSVRGGGKDWPHIVRWMAAGFLRGFPLSWDSSSSLMTLTLTLTLMASSSSLVTLMNTWLHQLAAWTTVVVAQLLANACLPLQ